jgi:E3 ubiquitin-protein ligase HUWE1
MQVDNSRPASSHEMAPPPPPAQIALDQLAEEDPAAQLQSLLSGISRSFEEAIAGPPNGPESSVPSQPSPTTTAGSQKGIVTVEDLDEERAKIRENLIERCLDIINTHTEFTFEIADLITTVVDKSPDPANMRSMIAETLVNALTSFVYEEDVRIVGKKVAAYAHLLALMLQDKPFYNVSVHELKQNIGNLLQFVKLSPDHKSEESSPWISHILLIIEILLSDDAQPRETDWKIPTSESSPIVAPVFKKIEHVVSDEQRVSLFESIIEILPRIGKDESLALAVLRILVILTRSRSLAQAMGEKKNIQRLFLMAKQLAGATSVRLQSPLMLILRHIIEDDETIKQIMRSEIKAFFDSGRTPRHLDVGTYVRQLSNLVIRQPELFVEVSSEMVRLSKWSSSASENPIRQQIELQSKFRKSKSGKTDDTVLPTLQVTEELSLQDVKPSTEPEDKDMTETSKPSMESKAPVIENPDGVIHFLLCELINYRDVEDQVPQTDKTTTDAPGDNTESSSPTSSTAEPTASSVGKDAKKTKQEFKPEEHPIYIYRCFLLQCLTELLSSYNRTKIEFINFKRSAPPQAMTPSKPRSNVLNYLLFDLIPSGTLENAETTAIRKKLATSSWADSVITALLSKTGEQLLDRDRDILDLDDEPDLLFVRKFVLENILKAYKEAAASSESLDAKYSRMLSLADLMTHIMSGKDNHGGGTDPGVTPHSVAQLKRIMFEKGYIAALTASIADIDLNFPGAKRAVKHILRPLKALTQTAIELSELGKVVGVPGQVDEEEIASASSVDEIDDEREETPDLFRNSTLGMFEPDRDHESSSESEDGTFSYLTRVNYSVLM